MGNLVTYKNDNLLNKDKLILKSKYLNFYYIFVKEMDFKQDNKRSQTFQKCIYAYGKRIKPLIRKYYKNKKEILKKIDKYCIQRCNLKRAFNNWFKKNCYPLIFLRIISKNQKEFIGILKKVEYFTDFLNKSYFKLNIKFNESFNNKLIYFIGCSMGDGHISKDGRRWVLVDGSSKRDNLKYSDEFVNKLGKLLNAYVNKINIISKQNKYILTVNNKSFCRFLNNLFELPYGNKKGKLKIPKLIKDEELLIYLWRGLFDTDGSVMKSGNINFCSINKNLIEDCFKFLKKHKIIGKINKNKLQINIEAQYLDLFKKIGLSHPRKQIEFLNLIGKDCFYYKTLIKDKFLKTIRLDKNGYRIRLCKKEFKKYGFDEDQIKNIFKEKFNIFPKQTGNLIYIKSKKLFNTLENKIEFKRLWDRINNEERVILQKEWNKIWN